MLTTIIIIIAYLLGALIIVLIDTHMCREELIALAAWPVTVPVFAAMRRIRKRTGTCKLCGRFYGSRKYLRERHEMNGDICRRNQGEVSS